MLFNSLQFLLFFGAVTLGYYSLGWRGRWVLLLVASCYFYMVFKPSYILILAVTIVIDYFAGIWIAQSHGQRRKWLLVLSLVTNIGFLAYFKYFDFFASSINQLSYQLFHQEAVSLIHIMLPIGLSFHTFQAMSYTIEVYRGNQKAERHFGIYALYVMFYPQLVAGPIERPQNLLPQFHSYFKYDWQNVKAGLVQMAWGFFKKVVIADRLAMVVDYSYDNPTPHNGLTLLVATFFFTFQIYCDFSGYSDIAIGSARVMGFNLMKNFDEPYRSTSISEFWSRWHISLSTWFRDYLYIPLGGNRVTPYRNYLNFFIVFMISGLWHGAKWTFVIWGSLHGIYLILARWRDANLKLSFSLPTWIQWLSTFVLVMLTWVFFRATGTTYAFQILKKITQIHWNDQLVTPLNATEMFFSLALIGVMIVKERWLPVIEVKRDAAFWLWLSSLVLVIYLFGVFTSNQFIYFQF
ncbi:MAG: MBOAT family O-acyltransferase [Spirosomataceae bacterium]